MTQSRAKTRHPLAPRVSSRHASILQHATAARSRAFRRRQHPGRHGDDSRVHITTARGIHLVFGSSRASVKCSTSQFCTAPAACRTGQVYRGRATLQEGVGYTREDPGPRAPKSGSISQQLGGGVEMSGDNCVYRCFCSKRVCNVPVSWI